MDIEIKEYTAPGYSPDSSVLIVENRDTCDDNSPTKFMSEEQLKQLRESVK